MPVSPHKKRSIIGEYWTVAHPPGEGLRSARMRFFRFFRPRPSTKPSHPATAEQDPLAFNRAWADYVEWSGLDEDGLPPPRDDDA